MIGLDKDNDTQMIDEMHPSYRKSDYLALLEKSLNPNVGPGSYNPIHLKTTVGSTVDWSKGTERFKEKKEL